MNLATRFTVVAIALAAAGTSYAILGNIPLKRTTDVSVDSVPNAVFPHWAHRIRFKCYVCHDSIFEMKGGANSVTMEQILDGKFCGTCHNNKIAWGVNFNTCPRCHIGEPQ